MINVQLHRASKTALFGFGYEIYVYKSQNSVVEIDNLFNCYVSDAYNTRLGNSNSLIVPNLFSDLSRQSVKYTGSKLWNGLPREMRDLLSYDVFKRKVKKNLMDE